MVRIIIWTVVLFLFYRIVKFILRVTATKPPVEPDQKQRRPTQPPAQIKDAEFEDIE